MPVYVLLSVKPQSRCRDDYPEPTEVDRVEVSVHGSLAKAQQAGQKRLDVALGQSDCPEDEKEILEWIGEDLAINSSAEQDYQIRVVDTPDIPDNSLFGVEVAKVGELFVAFNRDPLAEDLVKLACGVVDMIGGPWRSSRYPSGYEKTLQYPPFRWHRYGRCRNRGSI